VYISNESSANVFFDNLQVRHDRGRIIEENHYYAHGLKIAAISSKAYGAPNNNYGYQGDFSEMDDDLGWNDFELRSYGPQIGRFLQNDPYDQFASGYVGMGNDPVNGVDPSGGLFGGPGLLTPGGFWNGSFLSQIGSGFSLGINISANAMSWAGIAMKAISLTSQGVSLGQNIRGHNQNGRQAVLGSLYKSMDAAAVAWALENENDPDIFKYEFSSAIFSIKDRDGEIKYGYTARVRFENDDKEWNNYGASPRFDDVLHLSSLPKGAEITGHIHSHTGEKGWTDNGNFSGDAVAGTKDMGIMKRNPTKNFYLVGQRGDLINHREELGIKMMEGLRRTVDKNSKAGNSKTNFDESFKYKSKADLLPVGNWRKTKWYIPTWPRPIKINTDFPFL